MGMYTKKVLASISAIEESKAYVACKSLSVIVHTKDDFCGLKKTLETLKSIRSKEVLVINCGGCLQTQEYLNSKANYFEKYFKLRHISMTDVGIFGALNKGVKCASDDCEYINFINSGDLIANPEYFNAATCLLVTYEKLHFVFANIIYRNKISLISIELLRQPHNQSMIYRKKLFQTVGLFDEGFKIAGETDYHARLYKGKACNNQYFETNAVICNNEGRYRSSFLRVLLDTAKAYKKNNMLISHSFNLLVMSLESLVKTFFSKNSLSKPIKFLKILFFGQEDPRYKQMEKELKQAQNEQEQERIAGAYELVRRVNELAKKSATEKLDDKQ